MKKFLIFLFILVSSTMAFSQEKTDLEKDRAAIIALIEEETASYYANDFNRWAATQIQDDNNITTGASNAGFYYISGWDSVSSDMKPIITTVKDKMREVKSNYKIRIYPESAWVIFENETFTNTGESAGKFIATVFLEKKDNAWRSVYRNRIEVSTYYSPGSNEGFPVVPVDDRYVRMVFQANGLILNQINYAKSHSQTVEEIAAFTGDQFKATWNKADGYTGFVNGTKYNWVTFIPSGELKVIEQDDNHVKFSVKGLYPDLKNSGPIFQVTYEEYLIFMRIVHEKIAEYLGAEYAQELKDDALYVTIRKK